MEELTFLGAEGLRRSVTVQNRSPWGDRCSYMAWRTLPDAYFRPSAYNMQTVTHHIAHTLLRMSKNGERGWQGTLAP